MNSYIILFLLITIASVLNLFVSKKKLLILYCFIVAYLIIFSGFRDGIGGYDDVNYTYFFQQISPINELNSLKELLNYRFEILYTALNSFVKMITLEPRIIFLICSVISLMGISIFIFRYSPYPFIAFSFFLYKLFIYGNLIAVRQSVAMALFLLSIKYIENRNFSKYIFLIILATGFHTSALVLIPIYFINNINFKKIGLPKIVSISIIINILSGPILKIVSYILSFVLPIIASNKLNMYTSSAIFTKLSLLNIVEIILIMSAISYIYRYKEENIIIKLSYLYLIFVIAFCRFSFFTRINMYFAFSVMIAVTYIISSIKNQNLKINTFIIFTFVFFIGYIYEVNSFGGGAMINYKSWFLEFLVGVK